MYFMSSKHICLSTTVHLILKLKTIGEIQLNLSTDNKALNYETYKVTYQQINFTTTIKNRLSDFETTSRMAPRNDVSECRTVLLSSTRCPILSIRTQIKLGIVSLIFVVCLVI